MATITFSADTEALKKYTQQLEQMKKFDLPLAIRGTLNSAAFDVKQKTMPKKASEDFINRAPQFFIANSKVEMAQGFDINTMKSTVGFFDNNLQNRDTNFAVKDLEQQEDAGEIGGRSFVPLPAARQGSSSKGLVKPNLRISIIRKKIKTTRDNKKGRNWAQKAILTSVAAGVGGFVVDNHSTKGALWQVTSIKRIGGNVRFKRLLLYTFTKEGKAKVKAAHFMEKASLLSQKKMEEWYKIEVQKRINKLIKN